MVRIEQNSEPIPGYRLLQRIGTGGFGEVWKCEAPGGLHKAIKVLHGLLTPTNPNEENTLRHAEQELKALRRIQSIRHPYLLSLERYDIIENRLFIVMELADCNLWEHFRECRSKGQTGIPRAELLQYLHEAAEVLDMMFIKHQLQHLDIKPQNLFLLHNHVKVADFGLVKQLEGLQSFVTGGVTPVYAAPETLKGLVTPYCDQYSLAIVYQELLTGFRPFEGVNAQQLMMMHTHGSPNLGSLPANERAIIAKALAKIPENRFESCTELIQTLQSLGATKPLSHLGPIPIGQAYESGPVSSSPHSETPRSNGNQGTTDPFPELVPAMPANGALSIPEITGDGAIRPALVIGIGGEGFKAVKELRKGLIARFGPSGNLPNLRVLAVDTDPEKMEKVREFDTCPYLHKDEIIYAKLNRSAYYLKPRRNSQPIIEGWFDKQLLHKLPRVPQACKLRAFGRLAFIDHYRSIADRVEEFLLQTSHPDALAKAERHTRLGLRTNRPRIYIVAGLGGGTGGGMFIDMAQMVKLKLAQLGLSDSEVVGLFHIPPVDRNNLDANSLANCYASFRELHHYTQKPRSYTGIFDERDVLMHPRQAPYDQIFCFPQRTEESETEAEGILPSSSEAIVDFLNRELFTPFGKIADRHRSDMAATFSSRDTCFRISETAAQNWPRSPIHQAASDWLAATILSCWVNPVTGVLEEGIRSWVAQVWDQNRLSVDHLSADFEAEVVGVLGKKIDLFLEEQIQPLQNKGWFAREPEPATVWSVAGHIASLFGSKEDRQVAINLSAVESAIQRRTELFIKSVPKTILNVVTSLMEKNDFRLPGAIAANELIVGTLTALSDQLEQTAGQQAGRALESMRLLNVASAADRPKMKSPILIEACNNFVRCRLKSLYCQSAARIYRTALEALIPQHKDLLFCRKQLSDVYVHLSEIAARPLPKDKSTLFPFGANNLFEAVERFKESFTPEDVLEIDRRMQVRIEKQFQQSIESAKKGKGVETTLQDIVEEETQEFVRQRLKSIDFANIYTERFPDSNSIVESLRDLYELAEPTIAHSDSRDKELCVLGMPEALREFLLDRVHNLGLPAQNCHYFAANDEVFIYREFGGIPVRNLTQLGPFAEDAYQNSLHLGISPHTRIDVPIWADIESEPEFANES